MPRHTTEPTIIAMMVGEPHGYSVPPQDRARVRPAVPRETKTMPQ